MNAGCLRAEELPVLLGIRGEHNAYGYLFLCLLAPEDLYGKETPLLLLHPLIVRFLLLPLLELFLLLYHHFAPPLLPIPSLPSPPPFALPAPPSSPSNGYVFLYSSVSS